jgi:hypothetical protein
MNDTIKAITALTIDSATLTGGYDRFSPAGLPQACCIIRVVNASNTGVFLSYDAAHLNEYVPALSSVQLYFQANNQPNNNRTCLAKGTPISLWGAAGVGTIYFIGYYQN